MGLTTLIFNQIFIYINKYTIDFNFLILIPIPIK